jgi:hypothetical protein
MTNSTALKQQDKISAVEFWWLLDVAKPKLTSTKAL